MESFSSPVPFSTEAFTCSTDSIPFPSLPSGLRPSTVPLHRFDSIGLVASHSHRPSEILRDSIRFDSLSSPREEREGKGSISTQQQQQQQQKGRREWRCRWRSWGPWRCGRCPSPSPAASRARPPSTPSSATSSSPSPRYEIYRRYLLLSGLSPSSSGSGGII